MNYEKKIARLEQDILILAGEIKVDGIMSSGQNYQAMTNGVEDLLGEMVAKLQEVKDELGIKTNIQVTKGE